MVDMCVMISLAAYYGRFAGDGHPLIAALAAHLLEKTGALLHDVTRLMSREGHFCATRADKIDAKLWLLMPTICSPHSTRRGARKELTRWVAPAARAFMISTFGGNRADCYETLEKLATSISCGSVEFPPQLFYFLARGHEFGLLHLQEDAGHF